MPWTLWTELRRIATWPIIWLTFWRHGVQWGRRWRIFGRPIIQRHRGSTIDLGDGLALRSSLRSNPLSPYHPVVLSTRSTSAVISVGSDCGFTGATLVAEERIEIGNRVLIGANASLVDTNFHPLPPDRRRAAPNAGAHAPITVGDDVFIGMNSLILKGVTLGDGCVVGAGSVVSSDVPPYTVVAGNPATVVRELDPNA